jgi:microcystin-dependent protein
LALATALALPSGASAQEKYVGEIFMGGWNFCPRGSAPLNGQLLAISSNQALFSLLGTRFGGDGRTSFGLPDMQGRVPLHDGGGPGLTPRQIGQKGGSETNTLTVNQIPAHTHSLQALSSGGDTPAPGGNLLANDGNDRIYGNGTPNAALAATAIGTTGGGQPVNNMPPFQVIRYCIATFGIFPPRN